MDFDSMLGRCFMYFCIFVVSLFRDRNSNVFEWMLLNLLFSSSFGELSPTRILLHEKRGPRGFTVFRKLAFLTKIMFENK